MSHKILGVFDKAMVITLAHRGDRIELLLPELARAGIPPQDIEILRTTIPTKCPYGMWPSKYGCKISHADCVRRAQQEGAESVLLLEDDVIFHQDFQARWAWYRENLPKHPWGILNLGCYVNGAESGPSPELTRLTACSLGHAYAVHKDAYAGYLAAMDAPIPRFHDELLNDLCKTELTYVTTPFLAWQRDGISDLQKQEHVTWSESFIHSPYLKGFKGGQT